jgi:hypothetical protein
MSAFYEHSFSVLLAADRQKSCKGPPRQALHELRSTIHLFISHDKEKG